MSASELQAFQMTVKLENATLKELFDIIEEKFDYSFLIRNNDIDLEERITINAKNKSVEEILTNALKKQKAEFTVNDHRIIVYKTNSPNETKGATVGAQTMQQTQTISGTVIDEVTGEPVIGANVIVKGTTVGTVTDYDGKFSFEAPGGSTLVISYIGYINVEVAASSSPMTIRIKEDTHALAEVVVVGYGVQKRESLTGALQTLNNEKLTNITTPSVQNMLNGKAPGVYVAPGDGRPGSSGSVVIRGKASINGETRPLWVIDGVIVGNTPNNSLNPNDIETMTILKDAASTAIYGSQGANGVIVVTTKKGTADKLTINASAKFGLNSLNNGNMEVMNGEELYDYYKSFSNQEMISFPRWNENLRNSNYDWWDLATQTGIVQEYNISAAGGNEKIRSYFSLGYYDEEGAVKGYDYTKYDFRLRTEMKPTTWLTLKPLIAGSRRNIDNQEHSVTAMYSNLPWDNPYQEDGTPTPNYSQTWVNSNSTNYLYDLQWNKSSSITHTFMGNFDFDIRLTDWLTFASVNSYSYNNYEFKELFDPRSYEGAGVNGRIEERTQKTERRYTNQLLRLNKNFGKHALNGIIAYEFNDYKFKNLQEIGTGFVAGFEELDVAAKPEKTAGYIEEKAKQSFIFNAHYAYDSKYLAQVSFRRDGASNFGDDEKYGNFFSISGGWNIEREAFMEYDWLDQLKLRASYGTTGNDPTALYPQYDLYKGNTSYDGTPGLLISQIGRKDLTWEKTKTFGVGLDIAIFDRVRMSFDYYDKKTDNVLFKVPVSGLTGVTEVWRNIGEMSNKGFEMSIGGDIIKTKDWYWGADFNLGLNRNKMTGIYGDDTEVITTGLGGIAGSINRILKKGYDADTYYGREWAGVNPENGKPQWYKTDDNGNRVITESYSEADEIILGSYAPDFFGGFSTNLVWKDFDLSAVFGYSVGGKIYNYSRQEYDSDGAYTDRNQMKLKDGWSRWEKAGDIATHPLASYNNSYSVNSNKVSSRFIEDGDYLKLRSLTIGYNLKLPKWQISNLRIFISGENLFTITDYSGVDPEIPVRLSDDKIEDSSSSILNVTGTSAYPTTRKFIFGINITL
jgi:TonB-linked SusC/RagA family outer membrane protein